MCVCMYIYNGVALFPLQWCVGGSENSKSAVSLDSSTSSLLSQALSLQNPVQKAEVMQKLRVLQVHTFIHCLTLAHPFYALVEPDMVGVSPWFPHDGCGMAVSAWAGRPPDRHAPYL